MKRLFALSGNRCAFPKCPIPVVEGGVLLGEVCHIRAARPGGARYDATQTPDERHGLSNLILLCGNHHTVVDADEEAYTVDRLRRMKAQHEAHASAFGPQVVREFEAALDQSMHIHGQSGGFAIHTVQADTINVNSAPPSTLVEQRTMQAIEHVWDVMLRIEDAFGVVALADSILTREEMEAAFSCGNTTDLFTALRKFATAQAVTDLLTRAGADDVEGERPYLNRRLYSLYFAFRAVIGRCATLIQSSFEERASENWRDDAGVKAHVEAALSKEWVAQLGVQDHHRLYHLIDALKEDFLIEPEKQRTSFRKV